MSGMSDPGMHAPRRKRGCLFYLGCGGLLLLALLGGAIVVLIGALALLVLYF